MANAIRSTVVSTSTATTTATFTEPAALNATHGLLAMVRQLNATPPDTPVGWTLLPGSGVQGTMWTGVFAKRGDGSTNAITLDGPTASRVVILTAFTGIYEDVFWENPSSNATNLGVSLNSGYVLSTAPFSQAVAFAAVSGTAGGSGFTWSNSFTRRTGGSSSSSSSWAESTIATADIDIDTTTTWTSSFAARIILVLLRTAEYIEPSEIYPKLWRGTGLSADSTVTTASVGTNDAAFTNVTGAPIYRLTSGVGEIEVANNTTSTSIGWSSHNLPSWQAQFYFRLTSNSATASGAPIFEARTTSGVLFRLTLTTSDNISLLNSSLGFVANSPALSKGTTRYCISMWGVAGTGAIHIRVYDPVGTLVWSRDATMTNVDNLTTTTFGRVGTTAYGPAYFSSMQVGDEASEIPGNFSTPPTPVFPYQWNGNGVANNTALTNSLVGTGDTAFNATSGTMLVRQTNTLREIEIPNTTASSTMRWSGLNMSSWQVRFYFRLTNASATSSGIPIFEARTASGLLFKLTLGTNDSISLLNSAGSFVSAGPSLAKGTGRYRINVWGQAGTDMVRVRIYNPSDSLVWSRDSAVGNSSNLAQVIFGRNGSIAFGPAYYSGISLGNTATEPPAYTGNTTFGYVLEPDMTTLTPVSLVGVLDDDLTTIIPVSAQTTIYTPGNGTVDPLPGYRMPFDQPFAANNPYNTPIATTATYEAATATQTNWLRTRGTQGTVNHTSWSVNMALASNSDPLVNIRNRTTGNIVITGIRVPADFVPPAGSSGYTADANSVIVQPDGYTAHDFFKFAKVNDNEWLTSRPVAQDLRGSGIASGVRALGNSLANGLIRKKEIDEGVIPHALAISLPEAGLKLNPTSADGQLSPNGKAVWPGNQQDTQVPGQLEYVGPIPMGALFAIPAAVNVETLGLTGAGLIAARAAQQYGVYVTDRSGSIALYLEPANSTTSAASIRSAWREVIMPNLRRVTNNTSSTIGGGAPGAPRIGPEARPFDPSIPEL